MTATNLEVALNDLDEGIRDETLGSIEDVVIKAAKIALIQNWNDHNPKEEWITEEKEKEMIQDIDEYYNEPDTGRHAAGLGMDPG